MRVQGLGSLRLCHHWVFRVCIVLLLPTALSGQASYQAQIRGLVSDASGAVLPNATVTITEVDTNVSQTAKTDGSGEYTLRGLRPSTYIAKATASGFQTLEQKGVVLAVDQATTLNFRLHPAGTSTMIQVTEAAPLLDTESSALGTDITNQYVKEIPLLNRNFFGLVFLNAGVSEAAGSGIADNYPVGYEFRIQWAAECDGGNSHGRRIDQRPGAGRRWKHKCLLRTFSRGGAGI